MQAGLVIMIGIILIVIILNLAIFLRRAGMSGNRPKGRSRNYVPPDEAKRAEWREMEIARRIESEQNDAYERVKLRNETLSYYEYVRQKYAKKEALERLGIKVDDDKLGSVDSITPESMKYRDVRDDIYIYDEPENNNENQGESAET